MPALTLTEVRIWNCIDDGYLADADAVRIEHGRIVALGSASQLGDGATLQACGGRTLLPGLIDAHVHPCLNPEIRNALGQGNETQDPPARARLVFANISAPSTSNRSGM